MYFGQNIILQLKIDRKAGYRLSDNRPTFHVSRKTKQFIENQLHWLTVIFLPKRSPNLNPVETRVNRNLKKDAMVQTITMEQKRT